MEKPELDFNELEDALQEGPICSELKLADYIFAMKLAKYGYVRILTSQVSLMEKDGLSFSNTDGLEIPANWKIQWIGKQDGNYTSITFKILNI